MNHISHVILYLTQKKIPVYFQRKSIVVNLRFDSSSTNKSSFQCTLTMTVSIVVNLFRFVRCVAFVLQQQQQKSSN